MLVGPAKERTRLQLEAGKRSLLLNQGDLGERAGGADEARDGEAEPGAVEEQPRELGGGEQDVRFHVARHPGSVQLRAQLDEQGKHPAHIPHF
jgi:hypothetical protein